MPAIMPAAGIGSPYMPQAANWPISRKGEPASRSCASRCRGSSLPRETWRWRASSGPPCSIVRAFSAMSATSAAMRLALARKASEAGETAEPMAGMDEFLSDEFDRAGEVELGPNAISGHCRGIVQDRGRDARPIAERQHALRHAAPKPASKNGQSFVKSHSADTAAVDELDRGFFRIVPFDAFCDDLSHADGVHHRALSQLKPSLRAFFLADDGK